MRLLYQGKNGEFINEVPARDLSDEDIKTMLENGTAARVCSKDVSLAEFEGMLIKGGLYKADAPELPKSKRKDESEES